MRFAGDSMICAFLATEAEAAAEDGGLAAATLRSVQCASDLAENLGLKMLAAQQSTDPAMSCSVWNSSLADIQGMFRCAARSPRIGCCLL